MKLKIFTLIIVLFFAGCIFPDENYPNIPLVDIEVQDNLGETVIGDVELAEVGYIFQYSIKFQGLNGAKIKSIRYEKHFIRNDSTVIAIDTVLIPGESFYSYYDTINFSQNFDGMSMYIEAYSYENQIKSIYEVNIQK